MLAERVFARGMHSALCGGNRALLVRHPEFRAGQSAPGGDGAGGGKSAHYELVLTIFNQPRFQVL